MEDTHTHIYMCVRGALSCWFGDRGQSEYHSEKSQQGVCSGHLIGQASQVTSGGEGAFGNAVSLSTPGVT